MSGIPLARRTDRNFVSTDRSGLSALFRCHIDMHDLFGGAGCNSGRNVRRIFHRQETEQTREGAKRSVEFIDSFREVDRMHYGHPATGSR